MPEGLDYKVVHLAGTPQPDGSQYCIICGKLLSVHTVYMEGEEVFEERATKSVRKYRQEYYRCSELV